MRRMLAALMLSSMALIAAAAPAKPVNDSDLTSVRPVSTGVTAPHLVYSNKITIASSELPDNMAGSRVVLKFKLDTTGSPQNIQVVEPLTPSIDARVVDAVRKFRWSPAVLNNQTVPIDLNLVVQVQR
ncbi:TonB family protein [Acidobacteria bacterium AB60]|nr:TonB family protein [Acidobacteria bacterium AB60]